MCPVRLGSVRSDFGLKFDDDSSFGAMYCKVPVFDMVRFRFCGRSFRMVSVALRLRRRRRNLVDK